MNRRRRHAITLLVTVIIWQGFAWTAAKLLETGNGLEHADAIMVFSGAATVRERCLKAAELFHAGRAPLIVLTNDGLRGRWSSSEQRNLTSLDRALAVLNESGVPRDRIMVVPGIVDSTWSEAQEMKAFASANGFQSVDFVTSAYHSRRALWTLGRVMTGSGIQFGIEAAEPGSDSPGKFFWWFRPSGWEFVAGEWVKLIYYSLKYW